jgi:autotransporter-associated beta strand protein
MSVGSQGTLEFNRTDSYEGQFGALGFNLNGSGNVVLMTGSLSINGAAHTFNGVFTINSGSTLTLQRKIENASFVNNGTLAVSANDAGYWDVSQLLLTTTFNNSTTTYGYLTDWAAGTKAPGDVTGEIQSAGFGNSMSDFSGFVPGRIALVQRGPIENSVPFSTKISNAIAAGAIGVIIYNHSPGILAPDVTSSIPVAMITQSLGEQILVNLSNGVVSTRIKNQATGLINFNNPITGTGTFAKTGSATVVLGTSVPTVSILGGALRFAPSITVGTTSLSSGAAFEISGGSTSTSAYTITGTGVSTGGAIRNISGNNTINGSITQTAASRINSDADLLVLGGNLSGAFGLTIGGVGNTRVDGLITNQTTLTKDGAGTLELTAANTYTSTTTISAGTLRLSGTGTVGAGNITNNAALVIENNDNTTIPRNISGTGTLTKNLSGKVIFTGALSHTGVTTVNAGTLAIGAGSTTGSVSGSTGNFVINSGTTLEINRSNASTFTRPLNGEGSLVVLGGGTASFTGSLTHTGGTTVSAGTMSIGAGGTIGSITGDIVNNATLQFNRSDSLAYSDVISGTGSLVKAAAGTTTLSGNNTYSGTTTISTGTLRVAHANALGSATSTVSLPTSTAIELTGGLTFSRNLSSAGTGISSGGSLRNVSGNNTFNGNYTQTAASRINSDADTLTLSSAGTLTGTFGLTFGGAGNILVQRPIATSTGAVTKDGVGTLVLSAANTYTGNTTLSGGITRFATVSSLYNNTTSNWVKTKIVVNTGATFAINVGGTNEFTTSNVSTLLTNLLTTINNNGLRSGSSIGFDTSNSPSDFTISSNITDSTGTGAGAVGVVKLGTGTLVLSGTSNTYTGGTVINGGTLKAGNATCFGTGTITLNAGATLDLSGFTITNSIVNNGGTIIN